MSGNLCTALCDEALARGHDARVALREPKRGWSYATLAEEAARAQAAFVDLGLERGDTIALLLHDSMELAAAMLGAVRGGFIAAPINILLRPPELRSLLDDAGAAALVVSADLTAAADQVRADVPKLREVLAVGGARAGQRDYHALTQRNDTLPPPVDVDEDGAAVVLYSASAGQRPRGVAHGRRSVLAAHALFAQRVLDLQADDRVFSTVRLSTAYGLGIGLMFPLLSGASSFLLPARPRPRSIFDVMATYRPTLFAATPSLYSQMVQDQRTLAGARSHFQPVRHALSGAEGLPVLLQRRITEAFGVEPLHGFGMTEALHFVLSNRPGCTRESSAGQPLDGVQVRLVDDAGAPVAPGEPGLLELRGPTVATGYFSRAAAHGESAHRIRTDGWIRPGDRFCVDSDGHYYHRGRTDDLFKVSGRWVSPDEVERTLLGHPAVGECAVVEGQDEDGLPRPHAFVVPLAGHDPSPTLSLALMEYVKAEIAPHKYPRAIEFVDALPKGEGGRVQRWRLRPGPTA